MLGFPSPHTQLLICDRTVIDSFNPALCPLLASRNPTALMLLFVGRISHKGSDQYADDHDVS